MKKFLTLFAVAALALFAVSCNKDEEEEENVELTGIELSQASLNLKVGEEATLSVAYKPENATEKPAATWASSAPAIAAVAEGKVTAVAAGSATITATVGKFTASCSVTVSAGETPGPDYSDWDGDWGVIGDFNGWSGDVEMVKGNDGWYTAEVTIEGGTREFKFRRDKTWGDYEFGIEGETELDKELTLTPKKGNLKVPTPGVYKMMLKPTAALAKITMIGEIQEPQGIITIDGDFSDWANIEGVSNGTHGMFKFAFDDYYAYFYTWRTTEGRFSDLWGDGVGYVYFAFDLDNDPATGVSLNSNGPFEYIGYIYCFGGSASAPEIKITADGDCAPSDYTVANVKVDGKVDENGAYIEYRIPRSDIPALTEEFTVISWGNKDLSKVEYPYPMKENLNGAWSVIGAFNGWVDDVEMTEASDGWYVAEEVTLTSVTETYAGFKFRRDKDWTLNLGLAGDAAVIDLDTEVDLAKNGGNICLAKEAIYNLYLNPNALKAKVVYVKDIPEPTEPEVDWDYTPSAEYGLSTNIWKAVDAAHTVSWYYNPGWGGEVEAPEVSFKESTYEFWNKRATTGDWQAQLWITPNEDLILDAEKKYTFSCKVYATEETPVFFKLYQRGEDGSRSFETDNANRIRIPKDQILEIKVEDFTPIITPQSLLIDFGGIPANTKVFIKDIVIAESGAVVPPQPMDWDYTPGAAYLAANNLWKANAAGNEMYYYYHCTGGDWNGTDTIAEEVPFLKVTESTYELTYEEATANPWQNQFFIFPKEGHFVPMAADKKYKLVVTMCANADMNGFFKWSQYDAANPKHEGATIWEKGNTALKATVPVVIESPEMTEIECANIIFIMDFGGNPAGAKVFIKDITLVEVEPGSGSGIPDYDPITGFEW